MSKFLKVINNFLTEQDEENVSDLPPIPDGGIEPTSVDDNLDSKLPEPKDVALDIVKYKTLLKALREALYNSSGANLEKQREISNIDVDEDDLESLKKAEDQLMAILDQSESVPETQE
jgi:hypothetical protein